MKILSIADEVSPLLYDYFSAKRWQDVDLVLSCGDLPPELLDLLATSLRVPVLYVRGNHDSEFEASQYDGFENLHGRILESGGLRIAGFEGSRRYRQGDCQYTEEEMRRIVRSVDNRVKQVGPPDIVVTHAPPAGTHDADDVCHQGFDCFRWAIERWQPSYFVHGHMHNYTNGPRRSTIGSTSVLNACQYQVFDVPVPAASASPQRHALFGRWRAARKPFRPTPGSVS